MQHAFILPHARNATDVFGTSCIDIKLYYLLDTSNVRLSHFVCGTCDLIQWQTSANIGGEKGEQEAGQQT
jgi:hypothetical protein